MNRTSMRFTGDRSHQKVLDDHEVHPSITETLRSRISDRRSCSRSYS
jgi:hypothetical protein